MTEAPGPRVPFRRLSSFVQPPTADRRYCTVTAVVVTGTPTSDGTIRQLGLTARAATQNHSPWHRRKWGEDLGGQVPSNILLAS